MLGLEPDIPGGRVHVRSDPGAPLDGLRVEQVAIGARRAAIQVADGSIQVTGLDPGVTLSPTTPDPDPSSGSR